MSVEDLTIRNGIHTGIVAIAEIKPEKLDTLKAVLKALYENQRDNPSFEDPLSKVGTIHFAIWSIIDDGKRLLFQSNFDGDVIAYLKDFSNIISDGLDQVFSNCVGYPERGAKDYPAFEKFAFDHLVVCQHYYNAYPNESVKSIEEALKARGPESPQNPW